jgi:hypothetical protein
MGLTASTDGAKKLLDAAATARDSAATGSGKNIGSKREQDTGANAWRTVWTYSDGTAFNAWDTANASSPAATWTWW